MRKHFLCLVCGLVAFGTASTALAGELSVKIANGRATVIAKEVPVRQILAEWARVGETRVVNAEKIVGGPVTLELVDVPEKEALDVILRTAAGYIAAPRPVNVAGASQFDRVIVLATSRPPAATASLTPPPFGRPAVQPIVQQPPDDDNGDPGDQGPMPPPVMGPNGPVQQVFPPNMGPNVGPNGQIVGPNGQIVGPNGQPLNPNGGMIGPNGERVTPNGVLMGPNGLPLPPGTAPRPGMITQPQQQQVPVNPYAPANRPGPTTVIKPGGEIDK